MLHELSTRPISSDFYLEGAERGDSSSDDYFLVLADLTEFLRFFTFTFF